MSSCLVKSCSGGIEGRPRSLCTSRNKWSKSWSKNVLPGQALFQIRCYKRKP